MERRSVTLLETVHGSHLYGLARPESDLDTYRVVSNEPDGEGRPLSLKTKQKLNGKDDVLEINLTAFLVKCDEGVPQALEAMFSTVATSRMEDFRESYYVNTARFAVTYRRTILNFARLGLTDERALELLAPSGDEQSKKRVRESQRVNKPGRVMTHGLEKYRKHAVRLMLNRETGIEHGRFNPTLSPSERDFVMRAMALEDMKYATFIKSRVDMV